MNVSLRTSNLARQMSALGGGRAPPSRSMQALNASPSDRPTPGEGCRRVGFGQIRHLTPPSLAPLNAEEHANGVNALQVLLPSDHLITFARD